MHDPANSVDKQSFGHWRKWLPRLIVLAVILIIAGYFLIEHQDQLKLSRLAEHQDTLTRYRNEQPWLVYGAAFLLYVTVTGLSLPGATVMTLTYAWLLGFWPALILVSFASTLGATLAFLLSRFLFGSWVQQRYEQRLKKFNEALDREGAFYLFTLRLIAVVPFFVLNLVMGLTQMRIITFWWVSQLGMLPGTIVYVYAGSSVPSLNEIAQQGAASVLQPEIAVALAVMGIFPLAVKKVVTHFRDSE